MDGYIRCVRREPMPCLLATSSACWARGWNLTRQVIAYQRRAGCWEDGPVHIDCHRIKSAVLVLPSDSGPCAATADADMCFSEPQVQPGTVDDNPGIVHPRTHSVALLLLLEKGYKRGAADSPINERISPVIWAI